MIKLKRSITIRTSPEKVFDLIDDTANMPKIWRNLSNIRNLQRISNGGHSFQFDYSMAGMRMDGSSIDLEHQRPQRIVTRTTGGVTSTLSWEFKPTANPAETLVTLDITYEVPLPLVGKLAEIVIAKINDTDIVYVLNYLKLTLEVEK